MKRCGRRRGRALFKVLTRWIELDYYGLASMNSKRCPRCKKEFYNPFFSVCPFDKTKLISIKNRKARSGQRLSETQRSTIVVRSILK